MLLGIEICSTDRMRKALERSPFLREELFSQDEQRYCDDSRFPQTHYAARWAAKGACLKAHGLSPVAYDLSQLQVVHDVGGRPVLQVECPEIRSDLAQANDGRDPKIQLSISHERDYAVACVMVMS
jgi:holo-[acyl-carrier protein] synthase